MRFALALIPNPELIILDEPTVAMDVEVRRSFWSSMREFATGGRTVMFATHYLQEADDYADRVVVIAEVGSGDQVVPAALQHRPDSALLDVQMPELDGLAAAGALTDQLPSCRVIILTTFGRPGYFRRAMEAGATGFLVKDVPPEQLVDAIRRVHSGLRVVDPELAAETLTMGPSPLTGRERDVLVAASGGGTVAQVAKNLFLSQARYAITSRRPSGRPARPPGPRRSVWPPTAAGCEANRQPSGSAGPVGCRTPAGMIAAGRLFAVSQPSVGRCPACR